MPRKVELYAKKIRNGTVIDHISSGYALDVLNILKITGKENHVLCIVMNVPSKKFSKKDMVKIEDWELKPKDADKIALISPYATINIIREYDIVDKKSVNLPKVIKGIVKCNNTSCISNSREPLEPMFHVRKSEPLIMQCHYCSRIMEKEDILERF